MDSPDPDTRMTLRASSRSAVQSRFARILRSLLLGLLTAHAATTHAVADNTRAAPGRPKLIVLITIDGLPQRQVLSYRNQLAPDGFNRFLQRGSWFANAYYGHAFTVTAAGHATLLTGAYPHRTGIIGNEWRDSQTGQSEYCTGDPSATYIGHPTRPLDGTSPRNLKAETVGDVLRRANPQSKVISISGKDRGAILPAGKAGTAYMYMSSTGQFASSTYYMPKHPAWVDAFNAARPADRYFRMEWKALLPEAAYAQSVPDKQPWFGLAGGSLPARFSAPDDLEPGPNFYGSLLRGPFADALTLDFARSAMEGEQLGQDAVPDILSVSLSGHDYVNHAFSAESRLSHDHMLQLDRMLQDFWRDLDAKVGKDHYVAVLTADHGFMPALEYSAQQGLPTGRVDSAQMLAHVSQGLESRLGPGKWVMGFSGSSLLLNRALIAQKGQDANAVADAARTLLLAEPGIAAAYTRAELLGNRLAAAPLFTPMQNAWHSDVSGDVQYALKPNWKFGLRSNGTTHGSPHPYDTHVPIMLYGPAWIGKGRIDKRVEVADIASTLAELLGVGAPAASEGQRLPFIPASDTARKP
jgi:predicted AlkP superfamily pyrophosphatase or phosphodiesterase